MLTGIEGSPQWKGRAVPHTASDGGARGSHGSDARPGGANAQDQAGNVVVLGGGAGKAIYGFEDPPQGDGRLGSSDRGNLSGEAVLAILGAGFIQGFDDTVCVYVKGISGAELSAPALIPGDRECSQRESAIFEMLDRTTASEQHRWVVAGVHPGERARGGLQFRDERGDQMPAAAAARTHGAIEPGGQLH